MKKTVFILLILILLVFSTGCKDPLLSFEWYLFEAEGSYSAAENQSYLKLNGWVKPVQSTVNINPSYALDPSDFQLAKVSYWEYLILENETIVLRLTDGNISQVLNNIFTNVSTVEQPDYLWVIIESQIPIENDIFNGMNPDTVQLRVGINDSDGNVYVVEKSVSFNFTRE